MAVAVDAVGPSSSGTQGSTSPLTWTHVNGASASLIMVGISVDKSSADGGLTATVTYGGNALTSLLRWESGGSANANGFVQVFYLFNPPAGSNTVSVACTTGFDGITGGSISFTGAATPMGSPVHSDSNSVTVTSGTISVPTANSANMAVAFICAGSDSIAWTAGTSRFVNATGAGFGGAASYSAGATSPGTGSNVSLSWTQASDWYGAVGVEIKAAGSGAAVPPATVQTSRTWQRRWTRTVRPNIPPQVQQVAVRAGVAAVSAAAPGASPNRYIAGLAGGGTGWFTDNLGFPRLLLADNPWSLIPNAGRWSGSGGGATYQADIDNYCNARGTQGFTAIYLDPLGNTENSGAFADGRTFDGVYPFTVNGTAGSTASLTGSETIALNGTFWTRVDYFLTACLRNGITAMLNVAYEGPGDFATGANAGAYATMTASQFGQVGTALAARYATTGNIIWLVGNDYFGGTGGTEGGDDAKFDSLLSGLRGGGAGQLVSIHNFPESTSRYDMGTGSAGTSQTWGSSNAQFQMVYTYIQTYYGIEYAYTEAANFSVPSLPVIWGDGWFYNATGNTSPTYFGASDRAARQFAWWALSSGSRGLNLGSEGIWQWTSSSANTSTGEYKTEYWYAVTAGKIRTLLESLPNWYKLIPDTSSVLVTAGRGTRTGETTSGGGGTHYGTATTDSYVTASRAPDGSLAVIYMSHASTITVDTAQLVAGFTATWVDPDTCTTYPGTAGSSYNSGATDLTKPVSNSHSDPDWVLVLAAPSANATTANAGAPAVSATANAPSAAVTVTAGVAAVAAAAPAATVAEGITASAAAVPVVAPAATIAETVTAGAGIVLVADPGATVSTSAGTTANAGVAAVSLVANGATVAEGVTAGAAAVLVVATQETAAVVVFAGAAAVAVAAPVATAAEGILAGASTVLAAAPAATAAETVFSGAAVINAADPGATVSTSGSTNAVAGPAAVAALAMGPAPAIVVTAGVAAVAAVGLAATASFGNTASAGAPAIAAAAQQAAAAIKVTAGVAAVLGAANPTIPPFQVARSTGITVTDPRDGTNTVSAIATSSPGVT